MKVYEAAAIRNVAVVGHGGCGKTQLVSAALLAAGAVNRLGLVDDGSTVTDFDDEEIARKHTLASSLAYGEWQKTKINFIDTPGVELLQRRPRRAARRRGRRWSWWTPSTASKCRPRRCGPKRPALGLPRLVALSRLDRERVESRPRTGDAAPRLRPRRSCPFSCRSARRRGSAASWTSSR